MTIMKALHERFSKNTFSPTMFALALGMLIGLSACQPNERAVVGGLNGVVFNYDQTSYVSISVNGKEMGRGLDAADLGSYAGGGGSMCCNAVLAGATEAVVTLIPAEGQPLTVTAPIEKWWPDAAHDLVVHILPEKKVVVQITNLTPHARADLLKERQRELGLKVGHLPEGYWVSGPEIRIDGKN